MDVEKKFPKTYEAIMTAFAGESQARNKYDFFAKTAREEGHQKLAEFFEETARNEQEHAKLLFKLVSGIGDTKTNLQTCIDGENYESTTMYPDFAKIAKEEGHKEATRLFSGIGKIEIEHENMFQMLLDRLESDAEFVSDDENEAWICEVCGHVHYGKKALKNCPVCKHGEEYQSRLNSKK